MKTYQVSFYHIYPECSYDEEDVLTAFVLADSFENAKRKVEQRYKKEYESAEILAVAVAKKCEIIIQP